MINITRNIIVITTLAQNPIPFWQGLPLEYYLTVLDNPMVYYFGKIGRSSLQMDADFSIYFISKAIPLTFKLDDKHVRKMLSVMETSEPPVL